MYNENEYIHLQELNVYQQELAILDYGFHRKNEANYTTSNLRKSFAPLFNQKFIPF